MFLKRISQMPGNGAYTLRWALRFRKATSLVGPITHCLTETAPLCDICFKLSCLRGSSEHSLLAFRMLTKYM